MLKQAFIIIFLNFASDVQTALASEVTTLRRYTNLFIIIIIIIITLSAAVHVPLPIVHPLCFGNIR